MMGLLLSLSLFQLIRLALGSSGWNGNGVSLKQLCWILLRPTLTRVLTTNAFNVVFTQEALLQGDGTYFCGQQSSRP